MKQDKCIKCKENESREKSPYCKECHAEYMREWRKRQAGRKDIKNRLVLAQEAKASHKEDEECIAEESSCPKCHYWSGSISALSELLNQPGLID